MSIRSTAKALIVHQGKVLLNQCQDRYNGEYYALPGGGQQWEESLEEAVVRECLEETGYAVVPQRFVGLCEEICVNPEFKALYPGYIHKIYHIFLCTLAKEEPVGPTETDIMQIGIEWVPLERLSHIRLLPQALNGALEQMILKETPLFLGTERIFYGHG